MSQVSKSLYVEIKEMDQNSNQFARMARTECRSKRVEDLCYRVFGFFLLHLIGLWACIFWEYVYAKRDIFGLCFLCFWFHTIYVSVYCLFDAKIYLSDMAVRQNYKRSSS